MTEMKEARAHPPATPPRRRRRRRAPNQLAPLCLHLHLLLCPRHGREMRSNSVPGSLDLTRPAACPLDCPTPNHADQTTVTIGARLCNTRTPRTYSDTAG
ncbi:hypothetical protein AALO_G00112370 [Alosa alosa]|uniref:Uncharacterized protein n=1 Tax=Alosa alosa TaxID=278164 RepID=A0AAV6GQB8_9TELE|nr:hypothetical protein AALO_G00112370 [Alosa alosa]